MKKLVIPEPNVAKNSLGTKVSFDVTVSGKKYPLWYQVPKAISITDINIGNAMLCLFLIPAMKTVDKLVIKGVVSQKLIESIDKIQDIFVAWWQNEGFKKIQIETDGIKQQEYHKKSTTTCFSGGVDSFYTLLKHEAEIDNFLYIHGFDIPLKETQFRDKVSSHLNKIAKSFGKKLVEVETNIQTLTNDVAEWGRFSHGSAIASVAHLLGEDISTIFIPSSGNYKRLNPWGSHPLLDHLWSSESLKFVYDGAEFDRIEKVNAIKNNKVVHNHLRVCWQSNDKYNCSVCDKCIRTMASLEIVGKLQKMTTFVEPINYNTIEASGLGAVDVFLFNQESLEFAKRNNISSKSVKSIEKYMQNNKSFELASRINNDLGALVESPYFQDVKEQIIDTMLRSASRDVVKAMPSHARKKIQNRLNKK